MPMCTPLRDRTIARSPVVPVADHFVLALEAFAGFATASSTSHRATSARSVPTETTDIPGRTTSRGKQTRTCAQSILEDWELIIAGMSESTTLTRTKTTPNYVMSSHKGPMAPAAAGDDEPAQVDPAAGLEICALFVASLAHDFSTKILIEVADRRP